MIFFNAMQHRSSIALKRHTVAGTASFGSSNFEPLTPAAGQISRRCSDFEKTPFKKQKYLSALSFGGGGRCGI
jgi:hypothetical protein